MLCLLFGCLEKVTNQKLSLFILFFAVGWMFFVLKLISEKYKEKRKGKKEKRILKQWAQGMFLRRARWPSLLYTLESVLTKVYTHSSSNLSKSSSRFGFQTKSILKGTPQFWLQITWSDVSCHPEHPPVPAEPRDVTWGFTPSGSSSKGWTCFYLVFIPDPSTYKAVQQHRFNQIGHGHTTASPVD